MHKILLLTFIILVGIGPPALAQVDDAELEKVQAGTPSSRDSDSALQEPKASESEAKPRSDGAASAGFLNGRRRPGATFGLAIARPVSIGKYNHYDYLYGKKRAHPTFYAGYYLGSFFFDFGLVARVGYYHAEGQPLKSREGLTLPLKADLTDQQKDYDQTLGLTLIPVQGTVEVALSPFKTRWVVLRGWVGYEQLYVTETIEPNLPSSTSSTSKATYTSSGSNSGLVTGVMLSISLTGLDPRSDYSLRSLGVDRLYLSLYRDVTKTTQDKMGNFDRETYGIAFSFEGLR